MTTKWFRAGALLALASLTASASAETPARAVTPAEHANYRLQPGDVVDISVWKEEDLRRQALIRSDGGMSFPLAGDLVAAGLTPDELRTELETRLKGFIPDVSVAVAVIEINGNQVFVLGRVNRPGVYKFDRP